VAATNNLIAYAASTVPTFTIASLASDTNFLAGRSSILVDNTTNKYFDYLISGFIVTGTSPTIGQIRLYAAAMVDDSTWGDVFAGTDAAITVTNSGIRDSYLVPLWSVVTTATTNISYPIRPTSIASAFGGSCPAKFQLWIVHNTVAALKASGQEVSVKGVYSSSGN
jgi:hypothetical protein